MKEGKQRNHSSRALGVHECYDYYVDVEANGEVYYSFATPECDYTVYFNPNEYSNRIIEYPVLSSNSYGFGFFQFLKEGVVVAGFDPKIKRTVEGIISDFFDEHPNAILLYHCDYTDGRQDKRSKKFNRWYRDSFANDTISKHEVALTIKGATDITHYIGFLCSEGNSNANLVQIEFESFAVDLANDPK